MMLMNRTPRVLFSALLAALCCAMPAGAARILSVVADYETDGGTSDGPSLSGNTFKKFGQRELPGGREEFVVTWDAAGREVPAGATLQFEYQRSGERQKRIIKKTIDVGVTRVKRSRFLVSTDGAGDRGRVVGWKVQLLHRGLVLAEKSSPTWR